MKYLIVLFLSINLEAAQLTTRLLARQLWDVMEKETSMTYNIMDTIRNNEDDADVLRVYLSNPNNFKKSQELLAESFVDRVIKDFSRKEILILIKIFKLPEFSKIRALNMEFWDEARVRSELRLHNLPK